MSVSFPTTICYLSIAPSRDGVRVTTIPTAQRGFVMPVASLIQFPCPKCKGTGLVEKLQRREPGSPVKFWGLVPCKCAKSEAKLANRRAA